MKSFILLTQLSLAAAVCHYGTTLHPRAQTPAKATFGYSGLAGPLAWLGLNNQSMLCAQGTAQSPIDIVPSNISASSGSDLAFNIPKVRRGAEIENLGTALQVYVNGSIQLRGQSYALAQFHFHTPSEHLILGEHYPMEVHFVFQADDASLAVVGFVIELAGPRNRPSSLLKDVFKNVDKVKAPGSTGYTAGLNFQELFNLLDDSDVYQYGGSLTTPPCLEQIAWNVVAKPIYIDVDSYRKVKSIMKFNSRYVQNTPNQVNLLEHARDLLNKEQA